MQWRLLLEEFGPEILYIKQIHNTVVDAISQLDIVSEAPPYTNTKQQMRFSMRLFTSTGQSEEALKIGAKRGTQSVNLFKHVWPIDYQVKCSFHPGCTVVL